MNRKIDKIKNLRLFLLKQLDGLTTQQLNDIPAGYNNNVIWNLGHLICVQQNICYIRAGLPVTVDDRYFSPYMPGTRPERFVNEEEVERIRTLFITSVDRLEADFGKNLFDNYSPPVMIPQVYGFSVNTIAEAVDYLLYHEGFHGGYVLSLKRLLLNG